MEFPQSLFPSGFFNKKPNQMNSSSSSPKATLLTLPLEVRLQIYSYIFFPPNKPERPPNLILGHDRLAPYEPPITPPICLVSHQLRTETLPEYVKTRAITPWRASTLPSISHWLRSFHDGFQSVRSLDMSLMEVAPPDAGMVIYFILMCTQLRGLRLRLNTRALGQVVSVDGVMETFYLEVLVGHPKIERLELSMVTATTQSDRWSDVTAGFAGTRSSHTGTPRRMRRVYTFCSIQKDLVAAVMERLRVEWTKNGRNVSVSADDMDLKEKSITVSRPRSLSTTIPAFLPPICYVNKQIYVEISLEILSNHHVALQHKDAVVSLLDWLTNIGRSLIDLRHLQLPRQINPEDCIPLIKRCEGLESIHLYVNIPDHFDRSSNEIFHRECLKLWETVILEELKTLRKLREVSLRLIVPFRTLQQHLQLGYHPPHPGMLFSRAKDDLICQFNALGDFVKVVCTVDDFSNLAFRGGAALAFGNEPTTAELLAFNRAALWKKFPEMEQRLDDLDALEPAQALLPRVVGEDDEDEYEHESILDFWVIAESPGFPYRGWTRRMRR
ncbi:hypothetical protein P154DRAFT_605208 [Amniculicola lignicola CBS 123094]|uniref:Uncharacterized protein n=1 Tax=Amniculicola lignicola CBS 123094 TaxID=1392246 RepID=A0A6A5W7J5_9PLEO|nr:hypothetical protein P154DRAFT_605208 [Amniculicola lignicola CBS 123094]